jgi:hypothetical protein
VKTGGIGLIGPMGLMGAIGFDYLAVLGRKKR